MSFDIALSGIQGINEQLDTISNNIANAGTAGFKASRAHFSAMYAGGSGSGTQVISNQQSIALNGGMLNTGGKLDAAINGRGFFAVKDSSGQINFTRVGNFSKDASDLIIDANGRKLQGYPITPPSTVPGPLADLKIATGLMPPQPSTRIAFAANLSQDWRVPTIAPFVPADATSASVPNPNSYNMTKTSMVYDSRGAEHTVTQYFVKVSDTQVDIYTAFDGTDVTLNGTGAMVSLMFDTAGKLLSPLPAQNLITPAPAGADAMQVAIDYTGTSYQSGAATTLTNEADGYGTGLFLNAALNDDGSVVATYSNGQKQRVGMVALATFANEDALTPADLTSWSQNSRTGSPNYSVPGAGVTGTLSVQKMEGSNVDITSELVSLMGAQRNYQANSKVIATENQMLQSLMQAM